MKKKWLLGILSGLCAAACVVGFSACGHTHDYTDVVTNPTCTAQGYTTHTCECGATYKDTYVEATGHSFTDYVSDGNATYDSDGTKTATCDNGCGATDTLTDEGTMLDGEIKFSTLTVEDDKVTGTVSNAVKEFIFFDEITIFGDVTYIVSLDKYGTLDIPAKEIPLNVGNNSCYILVMEDGFMKNRYEVSIYRKAMYTVSFENNYFPSQQVEEGDCAVEPSVEPTKEGHTFNGWLYDFDEPVTGSSTIMGDWSTEQYTLSVQKVPPEGGLASTGGVYDYGTEVTVWVTKINTGYLFEGWFDENGDLLTTQTSYTICLKSNRTLTAKWQINQSP